MIICQRILKFYILYISLLLLNKYGDYKSSKNLISCIILFSRKTYTQYIPIDCRYYNVDKLERDFLNKYGTPFSYQNLGYRYPSFPWNNISKVLLTPSFEKHSRLLVVYLSKSTDFKVRNYLRNVMLKMKGDNISYCFAVASDLKDKRQIVDEYSKFKDIILFSHRDSYINLTLTVLSFFNYFAKHQVSDYIMKADTDCVINFKKTMNLISFFNHSDPVYAGNCVCGKHFGYRKPIDPPKNQFTRKYHIPCYSYGAGYLFSMKDIPSLMVAVRHLDALFINEDVNMGNAWRLLGHKCTRINNWILNRPTNLLIEKYYITHTSSNFSLVKECFSYLSSKIVY